MKNTFFPSSLNKSALQSRLTELERAKVGLYSVGLYPASLAYNCAMQTDGKYLLLAPRPGRELLGAFPQKNIDGMDPSHISSIKRMGTHHEGTNIVNNTLSDLILRCELVILSSNSNHIEEDLEKAINLREQLNRENVVLACLSGSFSHDIHENRSYVLCEKNNELAFFSGFHRHGSLRNPLDSFTANFCHPDALTAMIGAQMLNRLSPNIQVSSGVHNLEGQYIKAAKNMSSIFAGFAYTYHEDNPGLLPTVLTLLLDQCLDQAATVSMSRTNRDGFYNDQLIPLTELGYGVQRIEAALSRHGDMKKVRDHTFSQLTAMVADVRGSMMNPTKGTPTRNFQAGQVLANRLFSFKRCPNDIEEMYEWCNSAGLKKGGLEGLKSIQYWPQIRKNYSIPLHDCSMLNLIYMAIFGDIEFKKIVFRVLTKSRELTNYCQESVRPSHSRKFSEAINTLYKKESRDLIIRSIFRELPKTPIETDSTEDNLKNQSIGIDSAYIEVMRIIEQNI